MDLFFHAQDVLSAGASVIKAVFLGRSCYDGGAEAEVGM